MAMELPAINNTDPVLTSSNFSAKYTINSLIPLQKITYFNGEIEFRRDYLGSSLLKFIKSINSYTPYTYMGYEQITTICYKYYGTTTVVALVLMYNGLQHPLELIPGSILKLPDLSLLNTILNKKSKSTSNIGKQVLL